MMVAFRTVAAVALAVLLPGCSNFFGMCGPHFPSASWHEPGIYQALESISTGDENAAPGLPFEHVAAGLGKLSAVAWHTDGAQGIVQSMELHPSPDEDRYGFEGEAKRIEGLAGPTVSVTADNTTSSGVVQAAFVAILRNVTLANEEQIIRWAQQGSARGAKVAEIWYHGSDEPLDVLAFRVSVSGPFRLEALYNETSAMPEPNSYSGFDWHRGGKWGFRFYYDERSAVLPNGVQLQADARDIVYASIGGEADTATVDAAMARLKAGFQAAEIDVVGPRPDQFMQAVC